MRKMRLYHDVRTHFVFVRVLTETIIWAVPKTWITSVETTWTFVASGAWRSQKQVAKGVCHELITGAIFQISFPALYARLEIKT